MINAPPKNLPKREYTPYRGQALPAGLLARRNPFAQSSVSALKAAQTCRRMAFFQSVVGLTTPQHPAAAAGEGMHQENERWYEGGPKPRHPSLLAAIDAGLLPAPGPHIKTEEEFWIPTGVSSPRSPDGQLWLKGYMDLVVQHGPGSAEIIDLKSKGDVRACETYGLTQEGLTTDEQMACYGHVFHSRGATHLTVGHLYLVRDEKMPFAKKVSVVLTPDVARRTYLKLLDVAEKCVGDSQCGDWQAVPGNYAKCDHMFGAPCHFRPICHPEEDPLNPFVDAPVLITPPDAAPPLAKEESKKKPKIEAVIPTPNTTEPTVTENDFDAILNLAMGVTKPATPTTTTTPPTTVTTTTTAPAASSPPPPVVKSTPLPEGTPGAGDTDAGALDELLGVAAAIAKAGKPVEVKEAPKEAKPKKEKVVVQPAAAVANAPVTTKATEVLVGTSLPITMLCVGCTPSSGALLVQTLINEAETLLVAKHNGRAGVLPIAAMYQLDHGMWRGDFVAIIQAVVKDRAVAQGASFAVAAVGDTPAVATAVEALHRLAHVTVWAAR